MDQQKSGKFIQQCRKEKGITQAQLAQKIGVSEKAVSKWECGRGFPDASLMMPLCEALGITVNELLKSEKLPDGQAYQSSAEQTLLRMKHAENTNAKRLLAAEYVLIWFSLVILLGCAAVVEYVRLPSVWKIVIMVIAGLHVFVGCWIGIVIETKVGYYVCPHCGNKYVPTYRQTLFAMHVGRTRYMKCPKCGKRGWNNKSAE